jgi:hypothetical protein
MNKFEQFMDKQVEVEIAGNIYTGKLIDLGMDIMVLYFEKQFYYIPLVHVQSVKVDTHFDADEIEDVPEDPIDYEAENLSFRKILQHSKGHFVEIYVSGNKAIHGYLTSIMNDYFIFYSPVYKAIFVSMNHLKWLIPYSPSLTPYSLSNHFLPVNAVKISLSRTFEEQCKKMEGHLVVFDLGDDPDKIGFLQKADNQVIELVNAQGDKVCWNFHHLKTVYMPS